MYTIYKTISMLCFNIKLVTTFILIFLYSSFGSAQTPGMCVASCKWSISGGVGVSEYGGNAGVGFFAFDLKNHEIGTNTENHQSKNSPGIVFVSINKYHNENFDLSLRGYHGEWGYYKSRDSGNHFHHNVSGLEFTPRWKFWPREPDVRFTPYLTFGVGIRRVQTSPETPFFGFFGKDRQGIYEINLPAGFGFNFKITKRIAINAQSNLAWTSNTNNANVGGTHTNWLWNQTIGLTFSFCREKANRCYTF